MVFFSGSGLGPDIVKYIVSMSTKMETDGGRGKKSSQVQNSSSWRALTTPHLKRVMTAGIQTATSIVQFFPHCVALDKLPKTSCVLSFLVCKTKT